MSGDDGETDRSREAFELLGNDIRLDILLALLDRWRAADTEPQRYAELMRAVGMEDSGKFNYHLDRLRGAYVREVEDGYVPTASATALYRAVLAHRPLEPSSRSVLEPEAACPDCGETVVARYEGDFFTLACPDCDRRPAHFTYPFPTNGLGGRSDEAVLGAVQRRARSEIGLARTGQCPACAGRTTVSVTHENLESDGDPAVEIVCDTCTWIVMVRPLVALASEPRVAAALVALGVAVESAADWQLPEPTIAVASDEPLELELVLDAGERSATVAVDGDLTVRSVTVDGRPVGTAPPAEE